MLMTVSCSSVLIWRLEILKILLRDEVLSPEVDLKVLARDTSTFSGSDLKRKLGISGLSRALIIVVQFTRRLRVCSIGRSQGEGLSALGR
jgi:hypothetical protein